MHNYCTPHTIKENFENFLIRRCNYILLSQVYCEWQVVKIPGIILNNSVLTLNIPSLARQRCLRSWGPRRTPSFFFCNFSTVWCGRLLKLCVLGFWNYNSVIQALLASNILFNYFNRSNLGARNFSTLTHHSSRIWTMTSSEHCRRVIFQIYNA